METKEISTKNIHQGRNIREARLSKNMKQETLAALIKVAQSTLSKAENSKFVEEDLLGKISTALDIPLEYLKEKEQDASTVIFENNTVTNQDSTVSGNMSVGYNEQITNVFNPIEKMAELYERLLAAKDEKYADLEKRLQELEQKKND